MFRLGLTGSIATGKSTAAQMFRDQGVPVYSADDIVHQLYEKEAVPLIKARFPDAIVDDKVDRARLSKLVLGDAIAIYDLENIVHPMVREKQAEFAAQHEAGKTPLVVYDVPLLYETRQADRYDAVAVTFCDEDEQIRRALLRDDMTKDKLDSILERQMPQDEKRALADFEIDTNQSFDQMREQVNRIITQCHHMSESKSR